MGRSLEGPLVCLHNVELWAKVSADLIAIAVVESVGIPVLASRIFARSRNEIKGSYASAVALAEVNIIVDSSAKKVGSVNCLAVGGVRRQQHSSFVIRNHDSAVTRLSGTHADIESLWNTILSDLDRRVDAVSVIGLNRQRNRCQNCGDKCLHSL